MCSFAGHLRKFPDVFIFPDDDSQASHFGDHVRLHSTLSTREDRTSAVGDVIKCLGEELIPGIRNEVFIIILPFSVFIFHNLSILLVIQHIPLAIYYDYCNSIHSCLSFDHNCLSFDHKQLYPVMSSFGTQAFLSLERAAAPYFGIKVC